MVEEAYGAEVAEVMGQGGEERRQWATLKIHTLKVAEDSRGKP